MSDLQPNNKPATRKSKKMAPKGRNSDLLDKKGRVRDFSSLSPSDVMCPICLSIFIEPVTMPCDHTLCMPCFRSNVDKSALACPLCRKRISIWVRRNNKVIDEPFWKWIQETYSEKVQIRLAGLEDSDDEAILATPAPRVSNPGEIRLEYEAQVEKLHQEQLALRLKEEEASERTILDLQLEEQNQMEQVEKQQQEITSNDFQLAKQLREKEAIERIKKTKKSIHKVSPLNKVKFGPMDMFVSSSQIPNVRNEAILHSTPRDDFATRKKVSLDACSSFLGTPTSSPILKPHRALVDITASYSSESENERDDSLVNKKKKKERKFDKCDKENVEERKLETKDGYESEEFDLIEPTCGDSEEGIESESILDLHLSEDNSDFLRNNAPSNSQKESSTNQTNRRESYPTNEAMALLFDESGLDKNEIEKLIQEQRAIEAKIEQEKLDHLMALKLEKDLKKSMSINRRKGSDDQYNLRLQSGPNSPSSASHSNRRTTPKRKLSDTDKMRQTTLIETLTKKRKIL